jgi:hypothetical protein
MKCFTYKKNAISYIKKEETISAMYGINKNIKYTIIRLNKAIKDETAPITPFQFFKKLRRLDLPLTQDEWEELLALFELACPGITGLISIDGKEKKNEKI